MPAQLAPAASINTERWIKTEERKTRVGQLWTIQKMALPSALCQTASGQPRAAPDPSRDFWPEGVKDLSVDPAL